MVAGTGTESVIELGEFLLKWAEEGPAGIRERKWTGEILFLGRDDFYKMMKNFVADKNVAGWSRWSEPMEMDELSLLTQATKCSAATPISSSFRRFIILPFLFISSLS